MSRKIGLFLTLQQVDILIVACDYAESYPEWADKAKGKPAWEELKKLLRDSRQTMERVPGGEYDE